MTTGDGIIIVTGSNGRIGDAVMRRENDGWCPDVMKQLAAVQGLIESNSREVLRHHLESHIRADFRDGRGDGVVVELMETLKYDRHVLRATP